MGREGDPGLNLGHLAYAGATPEEGTPWENENGTGRLG